MCITHKIIIISFDSIIQYNIYVVTHTKNITSSHPKIPGYVLIAWLEGELQGKGKGKGKREGGGESKRSSSILDKRLSDCAHKQALASKLPASVSQLAVYTNNTPLIHPSSSGLLVTWAYLPHTTFPDWVTNPSSLTFTSNMVPGREG